MTENILIIYFDNCCYNYPYDDQSKIRNSRKLSSFDEQKRFVEIVESLFEKLGDVLEMSTQKIQKNSFSIGKKIKPEIDLPKRN